MPNKTYQTITPNMHTQASADFAGKNLERGQNFRNTILDSCHIFKDNLLIPFMIQNLRLLYIFNNLYT